MVFDKQTTVKINSDKWDILQSRGYQLQDIVDNAFNVLLKIDSYESINLVNKKEELNNKLIEAEEEYKKKIHQLNQEYETKTSTLKLELNQIKKQLENEKTIVKQTRIQEEKTQDFNQLYSLFKDNDADYNNEKVTNKIYEYAEKYEKEANDILEKLTLMYEKEVLN